MTKALKLNAHNKQTQDTWELGVLKQYATNISS